MRDVYAVRTSGAELAEQSNDIRLWWPRSRWNATCRSRRFAAVLSKFHNRIWIRRLGATRTDVMGTDEFQVQSQCGDPHAHQVVWLRNLDRVVRRVGSSDRLEQLHFADVGCGSGVPCLYAARRYPFEGVTGIDNQPSFILAAEENREKSRTPVSRVSFFVGDAAEFTLPPRRHLVFLFNPFGEETLRRFLDHNHSLLVETRSYVALVNDHGLEAVLSYEGSTLLWRNPHTRCSVVRFEL